MIQDRVSYPFAPRPAFGRAPNSQEARVMKAAAEQDGVPRARPQLYFAFDQDPVQMENFARWNFIQKLKFGMEMMADLQRFVSGVRAMGVPRQDTPVLFLLRGIPGMEMRVEDIDFQEVMAQVKANLPSPLKKEAASIGTFDPKVGQGPGGPEQIRAAVQAICNSRNPLPLQEAFTLIGLLISNSKPEDMIPLGNDGQRYVFRAIIPGESQKPA